MATPHVAGAVTLLWSAAPGLGHLEVRDKILQSVDPIPAMNGITVTGGRLNVFNAVSGLDSIPPSPVTDLNVVSVGSNTVTVAWTATGDDSSDGTAAVVDLRYSELPITSGNFDGALAVVPSVSAPQPAGTPETHTIKGLDFGTGYYFAMIVGDEQDNFSMMSNTDSATTLGIPQIAFAPDTLRDSLLTGGTSAHIVTIENVANGTLDYSFPGPLPGWLTVNPDTGRVLAGNTTDITFDLDATGLPGGDYSADIVIANNDPTQSSVTVTIELLVTDAPDISLSGNAIDYGERFIGFDYDLTLTVTNIGTATLDVSNITIDNTEYAVTPSSFALASSQSFDVTVTFSPVTVGPIAGTLSLHSDDPDQPQADVSLDGTGIVPPDIAISPGTLSDNLLVGQASTQTLIIDNTGGSDLNFEIEAAEGGLSVQTVSVMSLDLRSTEAPADVLTSGSEYTAGHKSFRNEMSREELSADVQSKLAGIVPGSGDLSLLLIVTGDPTEIRNALLAFPDITTVDTFDATTGSPTLAQLLMYNAVIPMFNSAPNGADTLGDVLADYVDAGGGVVMTLASFIGGWEIRGRFFAEGYYPFTLGTGPIGSADLAAFDAAHPIMAGVTTAFGNFLGATSVAPGAKWVADWNNGQPCVATQGDRVVGVNVFCATSGNWTGDVPLILRNAAAWAADLGSCWLSLDETSGVIPANSSATIHVTFDASSASCVTGGDYFDTLMVFSNDPDESQVNIPLDLRVTDAPHLAVSETALGYGSVFVGANVTKTLTIVNDGSLALNVTGITSDNTDYTIDIATFNLDSGESQDVLVTFTPTRVAPIPGTLSINSNDPDEPTVNVVLFGQGLAPPVIAISADSLSESLFTGGTSTQTLTIDNTAGGNDLSFEISVEGLHGAAASMTLASSAESRVGTEAGPQSTSTVQNTSVAGIRSEVTGGRPEGSVIEPSVTGSMSSVTVAGGGDVIRTIPAPGNLLGLTMHDGSLWAVSATGPQSIVEIDPEDGTVLSSFDIGLDFHLGLASDGANLWVCSFSAGIVKAYTPDGSLVTTWPAPNGSQVRGIAWDGEHLWIGGASSGILYKTDTNGTVVDTRTLLSGEVGWGMDMEWVPEHVGGPLWIQDDVGGDVNQYDVEPDPAQLIQDFLHPDPGSVGEGIAHDGEHLWLSAFNSSVIYQVDDGIEELNWLAVEPVEGSVPAGFKMDIMITFDAWRLEAGAYDADIVIVNNDPLSPELIVPAHLDVTPAPDIAASDQSSDYGEVFLGDSPTHTITLENEGSAVLSVANIDIDNGDYAVTPTIFDLDPGERRQIQISFSPTTIGAIDGTLWIRSNDPDEGDVSVVLHGEGLKAPEIDVTPTSFAKALFTGEKVVETMTITNHGGDSLRYDIAVGPSDAAALAMSTMASSDFATGDRGDANPTPRPMVQDPRFKGTQTVWDDQRTTGGEIAMPGQQVTQVVSLSNLPVVIADPVGDGGVVDVTNFKAASNVAELNIEIEFSTVIVAANFGGYVSLDTDQNPNTGSPPSFVGPGQDIGAEYELSFFSLEFGLVSLFDRVSGFFIADYPVDVQSQTLAFSVPLADLGNDDGDMDITGVLGDGGGPTDWFPDIGHGTIGRFGWVTVEPSSGALPEGGSIDVTVTFDASGLSGAPYDAEIVIEHNDPFAIDVTVPAHLDVTDAPDIALSDTLLDYGALFVGALSTRILEIENEGTDVLVVTSVASSNADYTTNLASFVVAPGTMRELEVTFAPSSIGPIPAMLTLSSNDPDEGALAVVLQGEGLDPPVIAVTPDSLGADLFTGETASATMTISNSGGNDLEWLLEIAGTGANAQVYTLTAPSGDPSDNGDGEMVQPPAGARTTSTSALLTDLTGVDILWDLTHGQYSVAGWSTIVADLYLRGATVTENIVPITPALLSNYDILWSADMYYSWSPAEIAALTSWVKSGGSVIFETDDSVSRVNDLLSAMGAGVVYSSPGIQGGTTPNVFPHPTTTGVNGVYFGTPTARLSPITSPGGRLVDDASNNGAAAYSLVQNGRVVCLCDETFVNSSIGVADNQLFANQVFGWLGTGASWVRAEPSSGTVSPGASQDIDVTFDAFGLEGGPYDANISVQTNDPVSPQVNVAAHIDVTAAPDIAVSDSALHFGSWFVGEAVRDTVRIENTGTDVLTISDISTNNTDFTVDMPSVDLSPGASQDIEVTFTPSSVALITGTLTITSNDPDEGVATVALDGEGLDPPIVGVVPDSLSASLHTGQNDTQTMTISNSGGNNLEWTLRIEQSDRVTQVYTLAAPSGDPSNNGDGSVESPPPGARTTPISALLDDLTGVDILWDRSHGQHASFDWSLLTSDLQARGATVTENFATITQALLDGYDILWSVDIFVAWDPAEIAALTSWVEGGGGVLFETDESDARVNALLASMGAGIEFAFPGVLGGFTTNVFPHATTDGVTSVFFGSPIAQLSSIASPAGRLVDDANHTGAGAFSLVRGGRVLCFSDETFINFSIGVADNQLLGNQAFDWLAGGTRWIYADPATGTVAPGGTQDVDVTFDAFGLEGGPYDADIVLQSNDPVSPQTSVAAHLDVTAAPDIALSDDMFDYGQLFVGATLKDTLVVTNEGTAVLVISSITSDNADFIVDVPSASLDPGEWQQIELTFAPSITGPISGTLTIVNNDPDEGLIDVGLLGEGLDPPVVGVAPMSLSDSLFTGGMSAHIVTISNTGGNDLVWNVKTTTTGTTTQVYTLTAPGSGPSDNGDGAVAPPPPGARTQTISARLADLSDVNIMWDRSHSQGSFVNWSTLITDLQARGATVTENFSMITPTLLASFDALWTVDIFRPWTAAETAALTAWVENGGAVLFETDESDFRVNDLLADMGAGIVYSFPSVQSGNTSNIFPHATTADVAMVSIPFPVSRLSSVVPPAGRLVDDINNVAAAAFSVVEQGRVVAVSDEVFINGTIGAADNQLFGNQIFDWLVTGIGWISVDPTAGTISPGSSQEVDVAFDAFGLGGGNYDADITVSNNDPLAPKVIVTAHLDVTAAPDIVVSETAFDYGRVFIGATPKDTLVIKNVGTTALVISSIVSNNADFGASPASISVSVGSEQEIEITYAPSTAGPTVGVLTITSDDPDESVVTVSLNGEGVDPPVIVVSPESISDSLLTNESSMHTMTISNDGLHELVWNLRTVESGTTTQEYTLTAPDSDPADNGDGSVAPPPSGARTTPITALLADLTGVNIMWERSHGQGASSNWSTILQDLVLRGAAVTENSSVITPALLDGYDVVWSVDMFNPWSPDEISALTDWVDGGGGLLFETDQSGSNVNDLLTAMGAGMLYVSGGVQIGTATNIFEHPTTEGVDGVSFAGPLAKLMPITPPAGRLVDDVLSQTGAAFSVVQGGRIVAVSDEMFYNGGVGVADNQLFANQIVDWLATGVSWITVDPKSGTVAPGEFVDVGVTFDAADLFGGDYLADMTITSNDPINSELVVPAHLNVTGRPDIVLSETLLDYGAVFIGETPVQMVAVSNEGTDELVVTSVTADNGDFTPAVTAFDLDPGQSQPIAVTFAPSSLGAITGTLTIVSNDPSEPNATVALLGEGLDPPIVAVLPDSLADSLFTGATSVHTMTISNTGGNDLDFNIALREMAGAGPIAVSTGMLAPPTSVRADLAGYESDISADDKILTGTPGQAEAVQGMVQSSAYPTQTLVLTTGVLELVTLQTVLTNLGEPADYIVTDVFVGIDLAPYTTILVGMDGGLIDEADVEALANEAASGKTLIMIGGTSYAPYYQGLTDYLIDHTGEQGWRTSTTPHLTVTDPSHGLSTDLPTPHNFINTLASHYMLRVNDPEASVAAVNGDNHPLLYTKEIGTGLLHYYVNTPNFAYVSDPGDLHVMETVVRNALEFRPIAWLSVEPQTGTVPPGESIDVGVTFDAGIVPPGDYAASIDIENNDPLTPVFSVPATLAAIGTSDIVVSDLLLEFGSVIIGLSPTLPLTITNTGNDDLVVSSITHANTDVTANPASFMLPPGGNRVVQVTFSPTVPGAFSGPLTIASNDPDQALLDVEIIGEGLVPPEIAVDPISLDEALLSGETSSQSLSISNPGGSSLSYSITLVEAAQAAAVANDENPAAAAVSMPDTHGSPDGLPIVPWLDVEPMSGTVAPDDTQDVSVMFDADGLLGGTYNAEIRLVTNIPNTPPLVIPVELAVTGVPDIAVGTTVLDFGNVFTGYPASLNLIVANQGTGDLNVSDISSSQSEISVVPNAFTLAAGGAVNVTVTVQSNTTGPFTGLLTIFSDDPDQPSLDVTVNATVVDPPMISIASDTIRAQAEMGQTVPDTVVLSNTGGSDLIWTVNLTIPISPASSGVTLAGEREAIDRASGDGRSLPTGGPNKSGSPNALALLDVLWHGDHEFGIGIWSVIISDIESRGAAVTESSATITSQLLAGFDVLWFGNRHASLTSSEVTAIASWVNDGGNLLIEADQDPDVFSPLLLAISFGGELTSLVRGSPGSTTTVFPHETTTDVSSLFLPGPFGTITGVGAGGGLLFNDVANNRIAAYNHHGDGRAVVISDQLFFDPVINLNDNRLFGNQLFGWFAGDNWLHVDPAAGVLTMGNSVDLEIIFDATSLPPGVYHQNIDISSNDPVTATVSIPVVFTVDSTMVLATNLNSELTDFARYELHANYPNPFNPTTTIRYNLAEDADVRLEIFNIKGERVAVLVDEHQVKGRHDVRWDGHNLSGQTVATGVYFYRLRAGDFTRTRKMQLLK